MRPSSVRFSKFLLAVAAGALSASCSRGVVVAASSPPPARVVVAESRGGPRSLHVPPGHYPPRGQCRVWHSGRPPGHQPKPVACSRLRGTVPRGAFVLYNGSAWDTGYDWRIREKKKKGSVPPVILDLTVALWK